MRQGLFLLPVCLLVTCAPSAADPVTNFYRGKTITIYVGTHRRGAVSAYPMAFAPVIQKIHPGNSQRRGLAYAGRGRDQRRRAHQSIAPQDGTAWGFITRGFMLALCFKLPRRIFSRLGSTGSAAPRARARSGSYGKS